MKICQKCGTQNANNSLNCSQCFEPLPKKKIGTAATIILLVVSFLTLSCCGISGLVFVLIDEDQMNTEVVSSTNNEVSSEGGKTTTAKTTTTTRTTTEPDTTTTTRNTSKSTTTPTRKTTTRPTPRITTTKPTPRITTSNTTKGRTVYWVSGGVVYHISRNCATLDRSKDIRSGTISQSGKPRVCNVCGNS